MTLTTTSTSPQIQQKQQQHNIPVLKRRKGEVGRVNFRIKRCPQHLLAHSIIPILVFLCWLPDFIVALKDVSVTIPQAVKRGSNAMLTCNYDMENDTLYSVKWYKGRHEFYRYTPKENPAMKVFPSQSGLNVERNLSNQSHVVLLAVPLNISGKFTCEISVEAPSFQTAMVSGEMEIVELPEEQATVTGIQARYRIGDLVDGNCSIKYSKPAANLTWTINGIVVPPHHIKTYQIEKYEETNLESVMSAVHFMVTTQHFIKGQMRLKCTASIFNIFKEEIESIIEEDRPRIMASGQSYPPEHGYGGHSESDGYEHNESYLTYFSAPKSSASPTADFIVGKIVKQNILKILHLLMSYAPHTPTTTLANNFKSNLAPNNLIKMKTSCYSIFQFLSMKVITATLVIFLVVTLLYINQQKLLTKTLRNELTHDKQMTFNCIELFRQITRETKEIFSVINLWHEAQYRNEKEQQKTNENCYQDANDDDCQCKCGQRQQCQHKKFCLVANRNVINEKVVLNDTNINTIIKHPTKNKTITAIRTPNKGQHHMSQAIDFATLPPTFCASILFPPYSPFSSPSRRSSTSTLRALASSSSSSSLLLSLSSTLGYRKTYAHDSFPLCAVDASKSNNAKYMSKDQTLLMTFTATAANSIVVAATLATSNSLCKTPSAFVPITAPSVRALVLESKLLHTSVHLSLAAVETNSSPSQIFSRNNYLMAFIGELLLHQC